MPIDVKRRANALKRIVEDEEFQGALTDFEALCVKRWQHSTTVESREQCYAEWQMLQKLQAHLRAQVDAGFLADQTDTPPRTRSRRNKE